MRRMAIIAGILLLAATTSAVLAAGRGSGTCTGTWCTSNPYCPDADQDGICNGQDPDYVPGTGNPTCRDDDGDGICNGWDPDFAPRSGAGPFARMCLALNWALGMSVR